MSSRPVKATAAAVSSAGQATAAAVSSAVASASAAGQARASAVSSAVVNAVAPIKPKLRGWLHVGAFPVVLLVTVAMVVVAPGGAARISVIVYGLAAAMLFGWSGLYHRGHWSERVRPWMQRVDHSAIFLMIAGSYTPFAVLLLPPPKAALMLAIVWTGALGGIILRLTWWTAPPWLFVPLYLALGWVAALLGPDVARHGNLAVGLLLAAGGALYTVGAVVFAARRPNPSVRWFGFHEVFHAFTVGAAACHTVAIFLALGLSAELA